MDKNIVSLEGLIGDDYKFAKTSDGREFVTFTLLINERGLQRDFNDERTTSQSMIRIFVYNKKLVEYMKNIKAHRGQRAAIFGRLSSLRNEYKGISYISMNVVCRDVSIIKTKKE